MTSNRQDPSIQPWCQSDKIFLFHLDVKQTRSFRSTLMSIRQDLSIPPWCWSDKILIRQDISVPSWCQLEKIFSFNLTDAVVTLILQRSPKEVAINGLGSMLPWKLWNLNHNTVCKKTNKQTKQKKNNPQKYPTGRLFILMLLGDTDHYRVTLLIFSMPVQKGHTQKMENDMGTKTALDSKVECPQSTF